MAVDTALLAALAVTAIALLIYWLQFDQWAHASNRYYLRTTLVVITPAFGVLSAVYAMRADGAPVDCPRLLQIAKFLASVTVIRACTGAIILCTAIHVVQTKKFVTNWTAYKAAVRALALGSASDPALGDPRFVSSQRISPRAQSTRAGSRRSSTCRSSCRISNLCGSLLIPQEIISGCLAVPRRKTRKLRAQSPCRRAISSGFTPACTVDTKIRFHQG